MVGPLGVLLVGPIASTNKVEEDVDDGSHGSAANGFGSNHHRR
jgi:hypothetical protein